MKIFFDVLVAVLAVFGGYSALKLLSERFLIPPRFRPSVAVRLDCDAYAGADNEADEEFIAVLTEGARAMWVHSRGTVVLIPNSASGDVLAARVAKVCPSAEVVRTNAPSAPLSERSNE